MAHDQHRANSWESYLSAHNGKLRDFEDHFLLRNELSYALLPGHIYWVGTLLCAGGIEVHVERLQETFLRGGARWVQTVVYKYEVLQRRSGRVVEIVRYDNIHIQPGHADAHHRHRFDDEGVEIEPPEHIGRRGWPT